MGTGGSVDLRAWAEGLCSDREHLDAARILGAATRLRDGFDAGHLASGLELAELVASMQMDTASVLAALYYRPARHGAIYDEQLARAIGDEGAGLFAAVNGMADISLLDLNSSRMLASEAKDQTANIRRMLVALIDDVRVAVLKLAERVVALRLAKNSFEERKTRIATEAMTVFVPLADRLGIWRLKWELEDLSLRYLEADAYQRIARQLDGRRVEREAKVNRIVAELREMFRERRIEAAVEGRAKHIYSIWRKMRTKHIPFDEVYDVLAVRVIVDDIAECYSVLGAIHMRWRHVRWEFDDYIAAPKNNGYRSIHTAVLADTGEVFEVQIRTTDMHQDAELGVCAHWTYKGGDREAGFYAEDEFYAEKVAWLRQVLAWQESLGGTLADRLREEAQEERVFVHTPRGHVVDLSAGATPLDFAYRVHTEIGQHCIGARVDGRRVALNTPLKTGQLVQIHRDSGASPRRAWLDRDLGYVHTARARSKIRNWLHLRERPVNVAEGRRDFEAMIGSLGLPAPATEDLGELAAAFDLDDAQALFYAFGAGELQMLDLVREYLAVVQGRGSGAPEAAARDEADDPAGAGPADESEAKKATKQAEDGKNAGHQVLEIQAEDREGLWLDVTNVLSARGLSLVATSGRVDPASGTAALTLELDLNDLCEVASLINRLGEVGGLLSVRRIASPHVSPGGPCDS